MGIVSKGCLHTIKETGLLGFTKMASTLAITMVGLQIVKIKYTFANLLMALVPPN